MDYIKLRQCKLGESCWVAAVPRPDICARLARIASRISALCGSDVCRINERVRVAQDWQQATAPQFASPSHPWKALGCGDRAQEDLRKRGDRVHCGTATLAGASDAACGDQSAEGKCRLGSVIDLMSPTLKGPRHISQWASKFAREMVRSGLGGEV